MDLLTGLLANCYASQKRTGKSKQFVFFKGDRVYKGPYNRDKMGLILARSHKMKEWNTPLIVHPIYAEGDFLVYDNVAKDYEIEEYEENQESFSDYSYKVAKRVGVDKMNYVLLDNEWIYDSVDLLEAMVHLWLLGVGDTGMFNILIDSKKKAIYVIDYDESSPTERDDESSPTERDDEMFYFSKHPAKKFEWYERVKENYYEVVKRLRRIEHEKVAEAISLLNEYGTNIGKMEWHGLLGGSITYSGYKLDEIKSGLQKYIRRGNVEKALQCAFEMYRMSEVTDNVGVITNLYNRLKIIAVEDIGLAGHNTVIEVLKIINSEDRDSETLVSIVENLATSKKTRICSHANATFCHPVGRKYAREKGIKIDSKRINKKHYEKYKTHRPFCDIEDETLKGCAIMMHKRLIEEDFNACYWYDRFKKHADMKVGLRYAYHGKKTTDPMVYIFEVLELFTDKEVIEVLRKAYFTTNSSKRDDRKYFMFFGVLFSLYRLGYEEAKLEIVYLDNTDRLINGEYELVLDDYVYDKHTAKGSHKGRSVFVTEGAHVENEDMTYHIDDLVDVYINYLK